MEIKKIYFDMDGVLADFEKGLCDICGIGQRSNSEEDDAAMWEKVKEAGHFFDMLDPMPGAIEMFNELNSKYECAILSAPPKPKRGVTTAAEDKISWIKRVLSDDIEINIVFKEEKKEKAVDKGYILIDDFLETIKAWEACGGTGVHHICPEETLKRIREIEEK